MADEPEPQPKDDAAERGFFDLPDFAAIGRGFADWCRANPAPAALLGAMMLAIGWFYFGIKAFLSLSQTAAQWIVASWNPENDQQHCWGIIPIAIFLVVLRWRDIKAAPKEADNSGLVFVGAGILAFIAGIRCIEGRYTIFALPLLCYGITRYLFGSLVARTTIFPCVFLLFMTPLGQVVQGTASLQSTTAHFIERFTGLFGMKIYSQGATIFSLDNKFAPLEVAGGCSGIRSLMAMMTLAALHAYFVMRTPARGLILFSCSVMFALVGNIARVFSVVLVARFIGSAQADAYHDYSAFVFFPVAVAAMVATGNIINRDWGSFFARITSPVPKSAQPAAATEKKVPSLERERERERERDDDNRGTYDY